MIFNILLIFHISEEYKNAIRNTKNIAINNFLSKTNDNNNMIQDKPLTELIEEDAVDNDR